MIQFLKSVDVVLGKFVRRELDKVIDLCWDVVLKAQFPQFSQVFGATAMVFTKYLSLVGS